MSPSNVMFSVVVSERKIYQDLIIRIKYLIIRIQCFL